ncbi:MAG: DUF998 domain-containing protein [Glaciihabitans sp.]
MTSSPSQARTLRNRDTFPSAPGTNAAAAISGSLLVVGALSLIWLARLSVARELYVSELGATGEPTAGVFRIALLLVVAGGALIAFASRAIRSRAPWLRAWTPAVSLWIACGFFLVAAQVTCTQGCPVPYGDSFTWQDLTHIVCAVVAFAASTWAMLQVSFAAGLRKLAVFSRMCGASVAIIAATGGILSLVGFATDFGSRLELVATTIAIGWVAVYGAVIGLRHLAGAPVSAGERR